MNGTAAARPLRAEDRMRRGAAPKLAGRAVALAAALAALPAAADLVLTGVDGALLANVLAHVDLDEEPCDAPRWRVEREYAAASSEIRAALEALGHYEPQLTASLDLERDDCWRATIAIAPGEPVRVRDLDVAVAGEGANDSAFAAAAREVGLAKGSPLDHGKYELLKRRWAEVALERGYADARFTANRIDVHVAERAADIVLRYDSGPRYRFGPIVFEQDVLADTLIESFVTFRRGDAYDNRELTELFVALNDSGFFRTIDVRPQPPDVERREIPVRIALAPAPRRLITYGLGYSTDTGPRFRFSRTNRRFNELGHQFGVNAQLSTVISEVTGNYRFPFGDPRKEWISFDAGAKRQNTASAESNSLEVGARRVVEARSGFTRTQFLSLLVEDFEVAGQESRARLLMPGIDWTRVRADNTLRTVRGSRMHLEVRGASDTLGSDASFLQVIADGKWIRSLGNGGRWLARGQLGTTWKEELTDLPASVRFFAGGDNSVRGYKFEALGPVNEAGEVVGGSSLVTASVEYEHPLRARWSVAFFADAGNAFESPRLRMRRGVGFGARWQSPLGAVRIDVAYPLDGESDSWRLHVNLGPDL